MQTRPSLPVILTAVPAFPHRALTHFRRRRTEKIATSAITRMYAEKLRGAKGLVSICAFAEQRYARPRVAWSYPVNVGMRIASPLKPSVILPATPQRVPSLVAMVVAAHVGECESQGEPEETSMLCSFVHLGERDHSGKKRGCILAPVAAALYRCAIERACTNLCGWHEVRCFFGCASRDRR
jgi:hypothetical protein